MSVLDELSREGLLGACLARVPWLIVASWLLLPFAWRKPGRRIPPLLTVVLVLWLLAAVATAVFVHRQFGLAVFGALDEADDWKMDRFQRLYTANRSLELVGGSMLAAITPLAAVLCARLTRAAKAEGSDPFHPVVFAISASALVSASASELVRIWWPASGCFEDEDPWRCRYTELLGNLRWLDQSRWLVLALAATATVCVLMGFIRLGSPVRRSVPALWAGTVLFVLGGLAWIGVRPAAFDGAHPLSMLSPTWHIDTVAAPPAEVCEPMVDAPSVMSGGDKVFIDGTPADGVLRVILRSKRELWMAVNSGKTFPGYLIVFAEAVTPMASMAPVIDGARAEGYPRPVIALTLPDVTVMTRTLGPVQRGRRYCQVPVPNDDAVASAQTWGDLASRAQKASELQNQ